MSIGVTPTLVNHGLRSQVDYSTVQTQACSQLGGRTAGGRLQHLRPLVRRDSPNSDNFSHNRTHSNILEVTCVPHFSLANYQYPKLNAHLPTCTASNSWLLNNTWDQKMFLNHARRDSDFVVATHEVSLVVVATDEVTYWWTLLSRNDTISRTIRPCP